MPIIHASEKDSLRHDLIESLQQASEVRRLKILDAGGGINSWLGDLVTHIMDINADEESPGIEIVAGDINDLATWVKFSENEFDFVSCTHTLEDIRDPKFVISEINRVGGAGFIAVPNRASEFTNVEDSSYLGYGHHRWIFHIRSQDKLEAVSKWIGISNEKVLRKFLSNARQFILPWPSFRKLLPEQLILRKHEHRELGVIWTDDLDFAYLNNDFAGASGRIMQSSAITFLSTPMCSYASDSTWQSALVEYLVDRHQK